MARGPHPTDRRATLVRLTRHGRAAAARTQAEYHKLAASLFGDLSAAELGTFVKIIDQTLRRPRESDSGSSGADRAEGSEDGGILTS